MKRFVVPVTILAVLIVPALLTPAAPASAQNSQQALMKTCNTQAGTQNLTGDARKSFMSSCLSGKATPTAAPAMPTTPQERMKTCNAQAGTQKLAGDARKTFMSSCLKS